ncbi:MAG TPA: hypothetical protein DCQ31_06330 [Bacteroidales bacterium]|nr:hypothetical protein [Bacteroidales bacterium]
MVKIISAAGTEEIYPKSLPDLFKGGNVSLFGKYTANGKHAITLSGMVDEKAVSYNYTGNFTDNSQNEFIAKLWASRKIAYLLENIRLKGENEELKNEVIVLAKKYGIITPYTAYLILEDEAINVSSGTVKQDNAIFNSRFGNRENMLKQQMKDEYEIMEKDKSARGVRSSEELQNLGAAQNINDAKQGNSRMIYTDQLGKERNFSEQSTFVAGRAIYQSGNSWVDSKVMQENTTKYKRIKFAESEYFELLNKNPQMAKFMALGKNVRFIHNNIAYEIFE